MKKREEIRHIVKYDMSIQVIRVYSKTLAYNYATKDSCLVVYRDENNNLVNYDDTSTFLFTKDGGFYSISAGDVVIKKNLPKQADCTAIIISDAWGFYIWAEDFNQINFFVTYDKNGLIDDYRIEYADFNHDEDEVRIRFEDLYDDDTYQEKIPGTLEYNRNTPGTVEYERKQAHKCETDTDTNGVETAQIGSCTITQVDGNTTIADAGYTARTTAIQIVPDSLAAFSPRFFKPSFAWGKHPATEVTMAD